MFSSFYEQHLQFHSIFYVPFCNPDKKKSRTYFHKKNIIS